MDTQANRMSGGWKVYLALQGEGTAGITGTPALPALTGTAITWGTDWTRIPSPSEDVVITPSFKFEEFYPAHMLHKQDVDLVEDGVNDVSFKIKETDIANLNLGLGTSLLSTVAAGTGTAGSKNLAQPHHNSHFPLYQMVLQATGPVSTGWGMLIHFPKVKRSGPPIPVAAKGKVRVQQVNWEVLAVENDLVIPEGTCYKIYQYTAAPLA